MRYFALLILLALYDVSLIASKNGGSFSFASTDQEYSEDYPEFAKINSPFPISEECHTFISEALSRDFTYGWISTSENPDRKDLPPVHIFYYHRTKLPTSPGELPYVIFNGGPSQPSHSMFNTFERMFNDAFQEPIIPAVYIDQRGTGCSSPYPTKRASPTDYLQWGTLGIVRDAEAVRAKLGLKKWNIFGHSFGSLIVQRYLQEFPQSIQRAIGSGGSAVTKPGLLMQSRLEQQARVIKKYLQDFPEDLGKIKKIIQKRLCFSEEATDLCGSALVSYMAVGGMGYQDQWADLHDMINVVTKTGFSKKWEKGVKAEDDRDYDLLTLYLRADALGTFESANCFKVSRLFLNQGLDPAALALSECWSYQTQIGYSEKQKVDLQKILDTNQVSRILPSKIREKLEAHPEIEYYLFSGEWDYYAPPSLVKLGASQIGPRAKYVEIKSAGHEAFFYDEVFRLISPKYDQMLKQSGY